VVLGGEPLDQRGDLGADGWPAGPVWVGPFPGDQAAVPPEHGARRDQPVPPQPCRQDPDRRGEDRAVGPVEPGPRIGAAQHCDSCRITSCSASLEADERPSRTGQPQTRTKIRYSRRRDTADHHGPLLVLPNRCSSQDGQTSASADSVLYIRGKGVGRRAGGACGGWVECGKRSGRHDGSVYLPCRW
jgi:hypothetical protein